MYDSEDVSERLIGRLLDKLDWSVGEYFFEQYLKRCLNTAACYKYKYEYLMADDVDQKIMLKKGYQRKKKQNLDKLIRIKDG